MTDHTALVERLRDEARQSYGVEGYTSTWQAAEAIEQLVRERDEAMREAAVFQRERDALKRGIKDTSIAWDSTPAENQRLRAQLAEALKALRELRSTTTPEAWVLIVPRIDAILAKLEHAMSDEITPSEGICKDLAICLAPEIMRDMKRLQARLDKTERERDEALDWVKTMREERTKLRSERDEALEALRKIREFYRSHGEDPRDQPQAYLWADAILAKQEPQP